MDIHDNSGPNFMHHSTDSSFSYVESSDAPLESNTVGLEEAEGNLILGEVTQEVHDTNFSSNESSEREYEDCVDSCNDQQKKKDSKVF